MDLETPLTKAMEGVNRDSTITKTKAAAREQRWRINGTRLCFAFGEEIFCQCVGLRLRWLGDLICTAKGHKILEVGGGSCPP